MIFKNKRRILVLSVLLAVILLAIPYAVKLTSGDSKTMIGEESYYTLRIVDQYKTQNISNMDDLTGKPISFNLYYYLLSVLISDMLIAAKIIPLVMGLLSLLFLYFLLNELDIGTDITLFSLIVLLISPVFLYTFTALTSEAFAVLFVIISAYLFAKKNILSSVALAIAMLTNFAVGIVGLIFMIVFSFAKNKNKKNLLVNVVSFVVIGILAYFFLNYNPFIDMVSRGASVSNLFIAFGAINGYSIIIVLLAIIGLSMVWKRNFSQTLLYLTTVIMFAASLFYPDIRMLVTLILATFAGAAINVLFTRNWNVHKLKWITLLLIMYIIIFSATVFLTKEINEVTPNELTAISYLSVTDPDNVILSVEKNGFMIEQLAKREAFLDSNSYKFSDYQHRLEVADSIYYSRNLKQLKEIMKKENINHILIDEEMTSGDVWSSSDEGILFLLENSDSFVKLFDNGEVQIYRLVD